MVGPDSESDAAVRRMSRLFVVGAKVKVPWVCIVLRKAYGLGAMAIAGGNLIRPSYTATWPNGEFGAMWLERAAHLGFKKELESEPDPDKRQALFNRLVEQLYAKGAAVEAASTVEIDAVIDPAATRQHVLDALRGVVRSKRDDKRRFVDVW